MKNENNETIMGVFIGSKSKICAIRNSGKSNFKKVKNIINNYVQRKINFNDYLECLFDDKSNIVRQHRMICILSRTMFIR